MSEIKERVQKWDILKFFLILCVVFGHVANQHTDTNGIFIFIYSFHMPLFIFVSGLFSKRTIDEKRYNRIFSYFVLYVFIKAIDFFSRIIFTGRISFSLLSERNLPWYAFVLFTFCMITVFLKNIDPKYVFAVSFTVALLSGYDSSINEFLMLSRTIVFYPFFYAGYILDPDTVSHKLNKKPLKIISFAGILSYIVVVYFFLDYLMPFKDLLSGQNPYRNVSFHNGFGMIYRLIHYVIIISLCIMIISLTPDKLGKGKIAKLGSRSVQVYALHYVFIDVLYELLNIDELLGGISPILPKLLMLPIAVIITLICSSKIWTPFFDFIMNPKLRKQ